MSGAPQFRSAILEGGGHGGALPPRRFGRILLASVGLHVIAGAWLMVVALLELGPVPPPPLLIQFIAAPPPPQHLVPLREAHDIPPPPEPAPKTPTVATIPPLKIEPGDPPQPRSPRPEPLQVEPDPLPIRIADAAPPLSIHDPAPAPAPATRLAPLGAHAAPQVGSGEEPDLVFLVPGPERARGPGGGVAGHDVVSVPPAGDPTGSIRRGGSADPAAGIEGDGLASEGAFTGAGLASFLGRKYGVTLMEASRLGSRTSDGARYAMLVPALTEAYRAVPFRGRRRGGAGDPVESVQADAGAIAIRYRDGTVHVLAPTQDGLVALYVSSRIAGAGGSSKVQEAERALLALRRFSGARAGGRSG